MNSEEYAKALDSAWDHLIHATAEVAAGDVAAILALTKDEMVVLDGIVIQLNGIRVKLVDAKRSGLAKLRKREDVP